MRIDRTSRLVFAFTSAVAGFNLLPHDCGSLGSAGRAEPTAGYSHARSKTFSRRRLIATSRNSLKGGRELSGKNLRHPAPA